jgi:cyclopropane-fatty-acyl-phospholipid synthase
VTATPDTVRAATGHPHWPGLDQPPFGLRTAVSAVVARRLFATAVTRLPVSVTLHETPGRSHVLGLGGPQMAVRRPHEFFARLGRDGLVGFGEAYLTRAWESDDLAAFLTVLATRLPTLVAPSLQRARTLVMPRPPRERLGTATQARANVAHHYDLSNDLFAAFLDPTMTYSSALFDTSLHPSTDRAGDHLVASPPEPADRLMSAQQRKIDRLLDRTEVREGTRLLEIGTGWGELAIRAARRGARVHSITLSSEQCTLARERIAAAGVSDRVHVELCDYRTLADTHPTGSFDAVVSVEMIEAVGHQFWAEYFRALDRMLAPGGRVGIQAITMPHDRMLATRHTHTWIEKYIFPGGFLPSLEAIDTITRTHTRLRLIDRVRFGTHYAETLRRWDQAFTAAAEQISGLGFDETFQRMWHFYLSYSRAGFASGYLDVQQLTFAREARP